MKYSSSLLVLLFVLFGCYSNNDYCVKDNDIVGKPFYKDGVLESIYTYRNNILHGVAKVYNQKGDIIERVLFLEDKPVVIEEYGKVPNEPYYGYSYYYSGLNDSIFYPIGSFLWNSTGIKQQLMLTYFRVKSKDTISCQDHIEITIDFHMGLHKDYSLELLLGEIDSKHRFVDERAIDTIRSNNQSITFTVDNYKKGINLLLGKLKIYKGDEEFTVKFLNPNSGTDAYVFFHEFYVK